MTKGAEMRKTATALVALALGLVSTIAASATIAVDLVSEELLRDVVAGREAHCVHERPARERRHLRDERRRNSTASVAAYARCRMVARVVARREAACLRERPRRPLRTDLLARPRDGSADQADVRG